MKNIVEEFINSYKPNPDAHYNNLDKVQFGKGLGEEPVDKLFGKIMSTPKEKGIQVSEEQKAELEGALSEAQAKQWTKWKEKHREAIGSGQLSLKAEDVIQLQKDLPGVYETFAHKIYELVQAEAAKKQENAKAGGFADRINNSPRKLSMGGRY